MKYTEFKKYINGNPDRSVFLIEGEDAFFRTRATELLKNKISEPDLNYAFFDGTAAVGELVPSLRAYPFMSKFRLTVIREFYPEKNDLKGELKQFLDDPPEESLFAVVNEKISEPLKKFPSVLTVDCGKADRRVILQWIAAECAAGNVEIERSAAELIADYCLDDMSRIECETHKLIAYAAGGTVTDECVDLLVSRDSEHKIYEMTDCVGRKKFDKALNIINDMLSKGETPQRILISVYNYYRRLLHVAISNKSAAELSGLLGIKEFAVKKTLQQSAMFKKRALKKAVDMLTDADYNIKIGRTEPNAAMWQTLFSIMTDA